MSTLAILCGVAAVIALATLLLQLFGGWAPEPFRSRPCQGGAWRCAFPEASSESIREFLGAFTSSFALRQCQNLVFSPHDPIFAVYRAMYPKEGWVDGLELETFALATEKVYGVKLQNVWSEQLTFGELFHLCREARAA